MKIRLRSVRRRPNSTLTDLARSYIAREAAIEALPGMTPALTRDLVRAAADDSRRAILAAEPASMADAVIKLRALLGFSFDRIAADYRRDEMSDHDADIIIGALHDLSAFLAREGGVPKTVSTLRI